MYQFSDSDSVDSDDGIRYKTESIRNKKSTGRSTENDRERDRTRRERRRSRSRSRNRYETDRKKSKKRKKDYSPEDKSNRKTSRHKHKYSDRPNDRKYKTDKTSNNEKELVLRQKDEKSKFSIVTESSDKCSSFGPDLPKNEDHGNDKEIDLKPEKQESSTALIEDSSQHISFGPTLPPKINTDDEHSHNEDPFGPQLPPHLLKKPNEENNIIGPNLPSHFITVSSLDDENSDVDTSSAGNNKESGSSIIGPALPPHMVTKDEENIIGPSLPAHLQQQECSKKTLLNEEERSDDEDIYGPVPVGTQYSKAHIELEERALKMKMDQLESSDSKQPVREEWMLTLPEAKAANFGLGPRQFRAKAGPDLSDRSSWTDTPEDKAKKKEGKVEPAIDLKKEAEQKHIQNKNLEQEKIAKKHKTEKDSLLEIHQKKLKKQKKSESGPSERRPFSRDIDLQVNRFDEAQKKAVLKKAQLLDTRFSSGESKFL